MLSPLTPTATKPVPRPAPANRVYTAVEQMPQLPGGGGTLAIVRAIQLRVEYPPQAIRDNVQGRVFVRFIVSATGQVEAVRIVKGQRDDLNAAVVRAVRELPRFVPGRQDGHPVAVMFTAPVTFKLTDPDPPTPGQHSWWPW